VVVGLVREEEEGVVAVAAAVVARAVTGWQPQPARRSKPGRPADDDGAERTGRCEENSP